MPLSKLLHTGTAKIGKETVFTTNKGTRHLCLAELNNWLFDHCWAHGLHVVQLPPLDDWTHSDEDRSVWAYVPDVKNVTILLKSEVIEFP